MFLSVYKRCHLRKHKYPAVISEFVFLQNTCLYLKETCVILLPSKEVNHLKGWACTRPFFRSIFWLTKVVYQIGLPNIY